MFSGLIIFEVAFGDDDGWMGAGRGNPGCSAKLNFGSIDPWSFGHHHIRDAPRIGRLDRSHSS